MNIIDLYRPNFCPLCDDHLVHGRCGREHYWIYNEGNKKRIEMLQNNLSVYLVTPTIKQSSIIRAHILGTSGIINIPLRILHKSTSIKGFLVAVENLMLFS